MARSVPLRRTCPEVVGRRMEQALQVTAYILHQKGPTGFVVKEEGSERKLKVMLGERHLCSCSTFKKEKELCRHILWVLLKKFRIPRENPITFQLGLIEREINEVLHGYVGRQRPESTSSSSGSHDHKASLKEIGNEDVCPICQEQLLSKPRPLTYCKFGCGNSMHIKCMKIWAEHQKSNGETMIKCPLCREDFGTYQELCRDLHSTTSSRRLHAQKSYLHLGVSCNNCHVSPIAGKCYKCTSCANYHLCDACFTTNQYHVTHPFEFRQHPSQPWRPAPRVTGSTQPGSHSTTSLPHGLINTLQSRSLTESDYDLLLQLDRPSNQGVPRKVLNSFHVEPIKSNSYLLQAGASCQLCMSDYCRGEWIRKLPCQHKFHRDCIDPWLLSSHTTCPIDGQQVYEPTARDHKKRLLSRRCSQADGTPKKRIVGALARALSQQNNTDEELEFTVSGQSIGIASQERVDVPTAQSGGQLRASTHILTSTPITSGGKKPPGKSSHFLPKISSSAITSIHRRKNIVESSKRLLKRRQNHSPSYPPSSDNDQPLAPTCSGYSGAPLKDLPSHSPPMGRLRKGSIAGRSGNRRISDTSSKDIEPEELLDSSLQVSSFKLCPLPTNSSVVLVSQS